MAVTANVTAVTASTADSTTPDPAGLRNALADRILALGTFRTAAVEAAFRTVPRELFLPGIELAEAYAAKVVVTKRAPDGTALSSASSPNVVAGQAEDLDARPGHKILEIGNGDRYQRRAAGADRRTPRPRRHRRDRPGPDRRRPRRPRQGRILHRHHHLRRWCRGLG